MQFTRYLALSVVALCSSAVACGGGSSGGGSQPSETESQGLVTSPASTTTAPATEYAPYFYTWGFGNSAYAFQSLTDMQKKTGTNGATLAFVLAASGACTPSRAIMDNQLDVDAFVAAGGKVKASFGGQGGEYLENACGDASSLANAISGFVDETGIHDLDFDVEQAGAMNATVNARRSAALASVQKSKGIKVSFTLAAVPRTSSGTPGGMTAASLDVVKSAVAAGVTISHVNLMTMDYGTSYSSGRAMGDLAISAVQDGAAQMKTVIAGLTDKAAMAMMGATPMIGQNDEPTEVFSVADAQKLSSFAKANGLGLLAFWAIQRDQPCPSSNDLAVCSQAQSTSYAFDKAFKSAL
jgi:chitinase